MKTRVTAAPSSLASRSFRTFPLALATLLLLGGRPPEAPAQIPDEFHNLQILPEDISKEELLEIMKGNSLGLGVRCWHCHVGEEGMPLSEFDFESDEKLTKRKARFMLQMVRYLNDERLPGLGEVGERAEPSVRVTCYTCHRGRPLPRTLGEVLAIVIDEDGIDAGIDRYGELRDELYGSGSYDFGELTLIELAQRLGSEGRVEDGIRILTLNLEHFPESGFSYFTLGEGYRMTGQREEAITAYRKAQELIPGNLMIDLRLEEIEAEGG